MHYTKKFIYLFCISRSLLVAGVFFKYFFIIYTKHFIPPSTYLYIFIHTRSIYERYNFWILCYLCIPTPYTKFYYVFKRISGILCKIKLWNTVYVCNRKCCVPRNSECCRTGWFLIPLPIFFRICLVTIIGKRYKNYTECTYLV